MAINRLALAALLAATLAASLAAQMTVELRPPERGHFWAIGPLPKQTAPILVGANGVRAYRLQELGSQAAIYGIESFAEFIPSDGLIQLAPAQPDDPASGWWAHPAVLDDLSALGGSATIGGEPQQAIRWTVEIDGEHLKRFRSEHDCGAYRVVIWRDVMARSPVVRCCGFIARKDRRADLDVPISIRFGEQIAFPLERLHGGRVGIRAGALAGSVSLETGGVYPLRFSLLCRVAPPAEHDPDQPADGFVDDLDEEALEAGASGARYFMPRSWQGPWLGADQIQMRSEAGERMAAGALARWEAPHAMTDLRPWASMPGAGQGGSQPSLALSWYAPLWVGADLRPVEIHLWCAEDLALRPWLIFEPGSAEPIADLLSKGASVASRQIMESGVDLGGQDYPRFQTRGSIPAALGNGNVDFRTSGDELHTADLPAVAAFACTGDPLVGWILSALRGLDLAQRRPQNGWSLSGRGEGRLGSSMLLAARCFPEDVQQAVAAHLTLRLENCVRNADLAGFPAAAISRPVRLFRDGRLRCLPPQVIAYEEATAAYGFWLLYSETRDRRALEACYRFGLVAAAALYRQDGRWRIPYAFHQKPEGEPLTDAELLQQPTYVHPSSGWTLAWSAAGLRALLAAAAILEPPAEHSRYLERAAAALADLDGRPAPGIDSIHQGLIGAQPAPPAQIPGGR